MNLKKLLLVSVLILVGALTASAALITSTGTKPSVGNGNSGSPYEIRTAEELRWFVHYENTRHWYPDDHAKLMSDIDLSSICGPEKGSWIPLGCSEEDGAKGYYYGDFDGNGHTISGMYQDGNDLLDDISSPAGFFGTLGGAHIKDLTVEGIIFNIGGMDAGGLAGAVCNETMKYNKIVNCESKVHFYISGILNEGDEEPTYDYKYCILGGLVGAWTEENSEDLENCVFSGEFHFSRTLSNYVGGLIGGANGRYTEISFYNCCAVTGRGFPMIGYANAYKCKFNNCITDAAIIGNLAFSDTESSPKFTGNIYGYDNGIYERRVGRGVGKIETDMGNVFVSPDAIANGSVCYRLNQMLEGRYFTQTLGTDKIPYPNSAHATVYRVKKYTACGTDKWVWTFSNTDEDDTTLREHVFDSEHARCTRCGVAVNPDYGISKDAEGYYLAATAEDIRCLWNLVNVTGVTDAKIRLTADIDMNNEAMEPLAKFSGIFDGQGHTMANINISCSGTDKVGLVGELSGSIRNLTLTGNVSGSYMKYLGAFAGYAGLVSSISNVRNDCTVKAAGTMNGAITMYMGGITGFTDGSLEYAINNGPVVDASVCTGTLTRFMAGLAGMVSRDNPHHLANNAVVGAQSNAASAGTASAVANMLQSNVCSQSYYTVGISNPGLEYFFSDQHAATDQMLIPTDVGSGKLAWLMAGKDYDAEDASTLFFGQTIGTDLVPYPGVSDAHKGVYNKKLYYTCSDYTEYSNSPEDGAPGEHTYDPTNHYCTVCYSIDENYVPKDKDTKVYLISDEEQFMIFNKALYEARKSSKPMKYASASIQKDLDFSEKDLYSAINNLHGHLHGNGHTINLGTKNNFGVVGTIEKDGVVEYLNVVFDNTTTQCMVSDNYGQMIGCNVKGGMPAKQSYGIVSNCSGENLDDYQATGRFSNCLVKNYTNSKADCYRLYNSNVSGTENATYTEIPLEKGNTGELAYQMSHGEGSSEWGQKLGTDTAPRIYYGQTKTSPTFVTSVTGYSVEHPEGVAEYYNPGASVEISDGCFKVCSDTEPWTIKPAYNFIIDNGDGTYTAEHIKLDPDAQHYLPMAVQAGKFSYSKSYSAGDVASLILPVDMPLSNINGTLYIFDGYEDSDSKLVFTSMLTGMDYVPANTPMLVKAVGGSILNADLTDVTVEPMKDAGYVEQEYNRHLTSYKQVSVPTSRTVEDQLYVDYYVMNATGTAATRATAEGVTYASQLQAYFRIPCLSSSASPAEVGVLLSDTRSLRTAGGMERDLFSLPYGKVTDGEWSKVAHLNDTDHPTVFYGNDIEADNYADLTAYNMIYITGKPNQTYSFYFNGSSPTEVTLDGDGEGFVDLDELNGAIHLRGIRVADGQTIAEDAFAKVYKIFFDDEYNYTGLALSGYGELADEHKNYAIYDATGISTGITLSLTNPNALVIGGPNVKGVANRIVQTEDAMQGFTARSLSITDGNEFCYDFSVQCPDVTFTRSGLSDDSDYITVILPFAVNASNGTYQYVDCDGKNVHFKTPDSTIPAYTPIAVKAENLESIALHGQNLSALMPNGTFNLSEADNKGRKYGFVAKRQANVPLEENAEVKDYDVYGYSITTHRFVRAVNTFTINPFRPIFLLPKTTVDQSSGRAATSGNPSALTIVIDGKEIGNGTTGIDEVMTREHEDDGTTYNLMGVPVGPGYRGIGIRNGKKIIIK